MLVNMAGQRLNTASKVKCGQFDDRESSTKVVYGVSWWAKNITCFSCFWTVTASSVNHAANVSSPIS